MKFRRKKDLEWYHRYKTDKTVMELEDGALSYYIIGHDWITSWREFVNGKGSLPGKVINKPMAELITR